MNHDDAAIAMHRANHAGTRHYQENVWEVPPREACGSRPVDLLWASPDCTHFSRAKGGQPRSRGIRSLASVVIRWAAEVRPRVILLENVPEFVTWGPLDDDGTPIEDFAGAHFRAWIARLVDLGYKVDYRTLVAADYGAPTTRKRLFLVARRDGRPIVWPQPSHGRGRPEPWRPAAAVINWSIGGRSIFERGKPLAAATERRIAAGLWRYVLSAAVPFIVPVTHRGDARVHGIGEPFRTVTAAHRGELALVAPTMIQRGYGERPGQAPRALDVCAPLGTVVAGGRKHGLVMAFLAKHYGGPNGKQTPGSSAVFPLSTVTAADHHALVTAFVSKFYGSARAGASCTEPCPTVTANGRGGGHLAAVQAFLIKYYGADGHPAGQRVDRALDTVTTRARFGLVTVHGQDWQIVDLRMRMLEARELFGAQGFPADYDITCETTYGRPLTKTAQVRLAGNSVPPPVAAALVRANVLGVAAEDRRRVA